MNHKRCYILGVCVALVTTLFGAWVPAGAPTVLTLDFGEHQVVLTDKILQGGW